MAPKPEVAGLEVMSGCLALVGGLPILVVAILASRRRRQVRQDRDLIRLMKDFILGYDRSREQVERVHHLLMTQFAHEPAYADVMTATASFVPGGGGHSLDEQTLAEELRLFLQTRYEIRVQPLMVPDEDVSPRLSQKQAVDEETSP